MSSMALRMLVVRAKMQAGPQIGPRNGLRGAACSTADGEASAGLGHPRKHEPGAPQHPACWRPCRKCWTRDFLEPLMNLAAAGRDAAIAAGWNNIWVEGGIDCRALSWLCRNPQAGLGVSGGDER